MLWKRQHWERSGETGGAQGRKTGHFPLVWLRQRGGVSHPVERHNAKWLFLPIPLWGSTEVRHLPWLVRCMEILHSLLSGKDRCVLFQFSRLGAHFRTEKKVKGGAGVIHYECMNSSLYNCLWSASRLVVKHKREWAGNRKLQSAAQIPNKREKQRKK